MRVLSLIAILGVTLLVSPAVAAPQSNIAPPLTKLFNSPSTPLLKRSAPAVPVAPKSPLFSRLRAKVVCGMTIVPVDSLLDPKIERPVPSNGTKFTIRTHKPPVCGQ